MKTVLEAANPFPHNRYGYLWAVLRAAPPGRHLDYGAYDGAVITHLVDSKVVNEAVGVDANSEVVATHKKTISPRAALEWIKPGSPLPFPAHSFDSASLLDVLEHVVDQDGLLSELHKSLRPGGILIVTTPVGTSSASWTPATGSFASNAFIAHLSPFATVRSITIDIMFSAKTALLETSKWVRIATSISPSPIFRRLLPVTDLNSSTQMDRDFSGGYSCC